MVGYQNDNNGVWSDDKLKKRGGKKKKKKKRKRQGGKMIKIRVAVSCAKTWGNEASRGHDAARDPTLLDPNIIPPIHRISTTIEETV